MENGNGLGERIKGLLASGKNQDDIYKELLGEGVSVEAIQAGFAALSSSQEKADTAKKTIQVIVTIGAVLVGAGIFSFIAANWSELGKAGKMMIILVAMLAAYAGGWYLKEKSNLVKTGGALIFLGSIIYGAGIFLTAQMFNIRANWPDGFILWMTGLVGLGFATEIYAMFYLAVLAGLIGLAGHPWGILNSTGATWMLMTSSVMLMLATGVTFFTGWLFFKKGNKEKEEI